MTSARARSPEVQSAASSPKAEAVIPWGLGNTHVRGRAPVPPTLSPALAGITDGGRRC